MANEEIKIRNVEHVLQTTTDLFFRNGIERTTKEMISRESGLSRKSIDRYFYSKRACVVETAKWLGKSVWQKFNANYSDKIINDEKTTGAQILKMYLSDLKKTFVSTPRLFVFYSEYKMYYARHDEDNYEKRYTLILDTIGCRKIAEKIFARGLKDGTLKRRMDVPVQAQYFCKSCFGFFSALAIDYEYQPNETLPLIDTFIDGMVDLYCIGH